MTAKQPSAVSGADGIRDAVSSKSTTAGSIIEKIDGLALQAGSFSLSVWDVLVAGLVIAGVIAIAWFASRTARAALSRASRLDETQRLLFTKLISLVVWVIAILFGIDLLGIDLTALTVFSGAFGLAIGFGLQKTFGNLIAGIILLMDRSIKPGDVIAIADQAGNETFGQIRKIGIRAVSIITRDEREYLIPNENLMVNQVENWSYSSRKVRIQVRVGISYESDLARAEELMLEAARACSRVLEEPAPAVWLDAFDDSAVRFVIHCWILDPEQGVGNVRSDVLKKLWYLFKEAGISIPFPQRDVNLRIDDDLHELVAALKDGKRETRR
jgi:small-conductance mechanosensitive channel